jgi:hypothetical protein
LSAANNASRLAEQRLVRERVSSWQTFREVNRMIVDLIILVIRLLAKNSGRPESAATRRKVKSGDVVLHCPDCNALSVGTSSNVEIRRNGPWMVDAELLECSACRRSYNSAHFKNDGTGVMVVNTWPCPSCKRPVPATSRVCPDCS